MTWAKCSDTRPPGAGARPWRNVAAAWRPHPTYLLPTRCACIDVRHAHKASRKWTLEMDVALVQHINRLCRHLAITPARLHPHEVYLDPADTADPRVACLLSMWPLGVPFRGLSLFHPVGASNRSTAPGRPQWAHL